MVLPVTIFHPISGKTKPSEPRLLAHLCVGKRVKANEESHDIDGDDVASVLQILVPSGRVIGRRSGG